MSMKGRRREDSRWRPPPAAAMNDVESPQSNLSLRSKRMSKSICLISFVAGFIMALILIAMYDPVIFRISYSKVVTICEKVTKPIYTELSCDVDIKPSDVLEIIVNNKQRTIVRNGNGMDNVGGPTPQP